MLFLFCVSHLLVWLVDSCVNFRANAAGCYLTANDLFLNILDFSSAGRARDWSFFFSLENILTHINPFLLAPCRGIATTLNSASKVFVILTTLVKLHFDGRYLVLRIVFVAASAVVIPLRINLFHIVFLTVGADSCHLYLFGWRFIFVP